LPGILGLAASAFFFYEFYEPIYDFRVHSPARRRQKKLPKLRSRRSAVSLRSSRSVAA